MLESPIGFRLSCGAKEQCGYTRKWVVGENNQEEYYFFQRREQWVFSTETLTCPFREGLWGLCATVKLQIYESTDRAPKLDINLTVTNRTMASEITRESEVAGVGWTISDTKCSAAYFNIVLSLRLFSSHLLLPSLQSLSVKWHRSERAERLCLLTGASEHLKWQRVTLAWVLEKMPQS